MFYRYWWVLENNLEIFCHHQQKIMMCSFALQALCSMSIVTNDKLHGKISLVMVTLTL